MHLNGGPVCYLRMNIGKVNMYVKLLWHFDIFVFYAVGK